MCRAYGLWGNPESIEITELIKTCDWVITNIPSLHTELTNSLLENYFPEDPIKTEERSKLKLDYSSRQFEIEMRTTKATKCPVCLKVDLHHGIFMNKEKQQSIQRKQYYKESYEMIGTGIITIKYKYLYSRNVSDEPKRDEISITTYEKLKDVCKKCTVNIVEDGSKIPKLSSLSGFDFGNDVPEALENLSFGELALVSRIQTTINVGSLEGGGRKIKGSISFIDRSNSTIEVAQRLPRNPADIDWLMLQRQIPGSVPGVINIKQLKCSQIKIKNALIELTNNSAGYDDVILEDDAFYEAYIPNGYIQPHILNNADVIIDMMPDLGPAPEQHQDRPPNNNANVNNNDNANDDNDDNDDNPDYQGVIDEGRDVRGFAQRIRLQMQEIHDHLLNPNNAMEEEDAPNNVMEIEEVEEIVIVQPIAQQGQFVSWKETPLFFCRAFPHLFICRRVQLPDGTWIKDSPADFRRIAPRQYNPSFPEWCTHLLAGQARYSADPILTFVLLSKKNSEMGLSNTSFAIKQMPNEAQMDKDQLVALFEESHNKIDKMASQMTAFTKCIPGSPAYWWEKRREVQAMIDHKMKVDDELPIAFTTGSMAEYHWRELHRILQEVLKLWGKHDEAAVFEQSKNGEKCLAADASKMHNILNKYAVILNKYFVLRTKAWFELVLRNGLGVDNFWLRFEFAKSRGAIHFHALLYAKNMSEKIRNLMNHVLEASNMIELGIRETKVASDIISLMKKEFVEISAEHPAGYLIIFICSIFNYSYIFSIYIITYVSIM
jgi:hypothetical protein